MPTVAEVRELLDGFDPGPDGDAATSCRLVRELLDRTPSPFSPRQYRPGHLTASGVVLSPDGHSVLLLYHRSLERWLQPGGHVEPADDTMPGAARREILEETGVPVDRRVTAVVVGVDVHDIPASHGRPAHRHHDIAFRFTATTLTLPGTPEHNRVVWCPVDGLDRYGVDAALRRSVQRALAEVRRTRALVRTYQR